LARSLVEHDLQHVSRPLGAAADDVFSAISRIASSMSAGIFIQLRVKEAERVIGFG